MKLVNLTPHTLNIHTPDGVVTLPPSGEVARVSTVSVSGLSVAGDWGFIPTVTTTFGEVTGLPKRTESTALIVSGMVASAAPRDDVLSPGDLVRDENGRPVGCLGLRRSQ